MTLKRMGLSLMRVNGAPADLHLDDMGNLATVTDTEAVGQHVRQRLMSYEGEWFLDKSVGVPWLTEVMGGSYDPVVAEALTKAEILETDGVTEVSSFSIRFNRAVRGIESYNIAVETVYGEEVSL